MKRLGLLLATALVIAAGPAGAQELVFFEGEVRIYERVDGRLFELQDSRDRLIDFGYRLSADYVIRTGRGTAEIVLPNGHILKLAADTEVALEQVLAAGARTGTDIVSVTAGRVRSVVSGLTGTDRAFQVRTPTAVGGVRGTDFVTQVGDGTELIAVLQGLVDFTNAGGVTLSLAANQFANALAETFTASFAQNIMEQFYGTLGELSQQAQTARERLLGAADPQQPAEPPEEPAPPAEPAEDSAEDTAEQPAAPVTPTTVQPTVVEPSTADASRERPARPAGDGPTGEFMANLADALGLEIGSITLEGQTYSKLVAQPTFRIGRLRAGLYLPVIYTGNLFDPSDWYRPKGNNEWSFGTDQDWANDPFGALLDLTGDLALKIKFIEWGSQRDPFFFKVGNLNTLTLGHGLLMRNYANDTEFPAVRRIGFNLGVDSGRYGFEALANDLAAPEIFGARVYMRPLSGFPLAVGLSAVTDIGPARVLPPTDAVGDPLFANERAADPLFLNASLDLDLPVIERDSLTLVLYGDVGGMMPYLRAPAAGLDAGLQWQAMVHGTGPEAQLRNYGIAAGLFGNLWLLDYRLEFQNFHGFFRPAFYDANYDRIRGERAREVIDYLLDPEAERYASQTVGVFGQAGLTIAELVRLQAGYLWPWTRDAATDTIVIGDNDYLVASLAVREGLLPLGISAGISYERTVFVPTLLAKSGFENARLFDENTILKGEIVYPVAPIMDIVASITSTVLRDADGFIVYEDRGGVLRPKYGPVITIETRIGAPGGF